MNQSQEIIVDNTASVQAASSTTHAKTVEIVFTDKPSLSPCGTEMSGYMFAADTPSEEDLPNSGNLRPANLKGTIARTIRKSVETDPDAFVQRSKGIVIQGSSFHLTNNHRIVKVTNPTIIDGGHTCGVMRQVIENDPLNNATVAIRIQQNVSESDCRANAIAQNTMRAPSRKTIAHHHGIFDNLKKVTQGFPHGDEFGFVENHPGKLCGVSQVLMPLTAFVHHQPHTAYGQKAGCIKHLEHNPSVYEDLTPLIRDILFLKERIEFSAGPLYNRVLGGKAGKFCFVERAKTEYDFPLNNRRSTHRLCRAAALPMLAAFRSQIRRNSSTQLFEWVQDFDGVLELWESVAPSLMKLTQQTALDVNRKLSELGRSRGHWRLCAAEVAKVAAERRA